jgi:hypothetical protein
MCELIFETAKFIMLMLKEGLYGRKAGRSK